MFRSRLPRQSSEDDEEDAIETGSRSMSSEGASSELVLATLVVEFDGATKSNPGVGGSGAVVFEEDFEGEREAVIEAGRFVGHCTNNEAEWIGAVLGIGLATDWPRASHARIVVRGDSELVIKQLTGEYKVKKKHLAGHYHEAIRMLDTYFPGRWEADHVPRQLNQKADALANEACKFGRDFTRILKAREQLELVNDFETLSLTENPVERVAGCALLDDFPRNRELYHTPALKEEYSDMHQINDCTVTWYTHIIALVTFVNNQSPTKQTIVNVCDHFDRLSQFLSAEIDLLRVPSLQVTKNPPQLPLDITDAVLKYMMPVFSVESMIGERKDFQARYLLQECLLHVGEFKIREAEFQARESLWLECADTVSQGYTIINAVLAEADDWFVAALVTRERQEVRSEYELDDKGNEECDGQEGVTDASHDYEQLVALLDPLRHACGHAVRMRDLILKMCESRRQRLERQLAPKLRDRDGVKQKWGEERWKSNPTPKNDYATRRRELEEELQMLGGAIDVIEILQLMELPGQM